MPRGTQQLPFDMGPEVEMIEEIGNISQSSIITQTSSLKNAETVKSEVIENVKPGTSQSKSNAPAKMLTFHINHSNRTYKIDLSELSTVGTYLNIYFFFPFL